ncbi:MAG: hypothetical protein LBI42_00770 [Chitinispirillales bacterium]|nr:hypothetical protein [Chitinispirillales bacterium]
MGQKEKKSYLESILPRYKASGKHAKKLILDEFCAVCGYNRKYAIRLLNKPWCLPPLLYTVKAKPLFLK